MEYTTLNPATAEVILLSSTHVTFIKMDHKQSPNKNFNKSQEIKII